MKTDFKNQLWLSLGILVAAIVVTAGAIYYFAGDLGRQADAIAAQKNLMSAQNNASFELAHLKNDGPKAADYTTAMNELWSTEDDLIGFPQWLQNVGSNDNVSAESVFAGTPTSPTGGAGTAGFSMTAQGTLSDLTLFLVDLESRSTGFLVSIGSFDLTYQAPEYRLSGEGTIYFR